MHENYEKRARIASNRIKIGYSPVGREGQANNNIITLGMLLAMLSIVFFVKYKGYM